MLKGYQYEDLLGRYQSERDAETGSVHEVGYNSYTMNIVVDDLKILGAYPKRLTEGIR